MGLTKPIVNPSRLSTWFSCLLLYNESYNKWVGRASELDDKPELGSLLHALHAAHEFKAPWRPVLKREVSSLRRSVHYTVKQALKVDQLEKDAILIHAGGSFKNGKGQLQVVESYANWRAHQKYKTVSVEERLFVDVGPVILTPQLDQVVVRENPVTGNEQWWVVEDKSTAREDKSWELRWTLDGQTTAQLIAAEEHFDKDFAGVMVRKILITRQKPKDWNRPYPPPLSKVERFEPRWVNKPLELRALYMSFLEDFAKEYNWRAKEGIWPATGMHNRHCDFCNRKNICAGKENSSVLIPLPKDDVQKRIEQKLKRK